MHQGVVNMIHMEYILEDIVRILTVVPFTLLSAVLILAVGVALGMIWALIQLYRVPVLSGAVKGLIACIRGVPLLIHLYLAYCLLPGVIQVLFGPETEVPALAVMLAAYGIYISAGQSENMRGAFTAVEQGQWDAAASIGMGRWQTLKRVVFPQMVRIVTPVIFNSYLGVVKGMSLAFTIGVQDIMAVAKLCSLENYGYLESYIAAGLVYWVLCQVMGTGFKKLETAIPY